MMLGDLGAEVIKVERPDGGDVTRTWGPPFTEDGDSAYYLSVNRNKMSVALDLTDEAQRATAREIALSADVVIENFLAGTMERHGLDHESLRVTNPRIIHCRISGFGDEGGRGQPGYDFLTQALSGLMSITGAPDGPPMKTGVAIVDVLTGLHATIGILAALNEREHSGRGQAIEVNLLSSAIASLVNQASSYLTTGTVPSRMSNQHPNIAPYETFATATVPIAVAVGSDPQFRDLCTALGEPALADDVRWSSNADRVENRSALIEALESILEGRKCEEWVELLRDHDVPCGPIHDIAEAFELARDLGLDPVQHLARADGSTVATVSNPITFSRTPVTYRLPPPELDGGEAERD